MEKMVKNTDSPLKTERARLQGMELISAAAQQSARMLELESMQEQEPNRQIISFVACAGSAMPTRKIIRATGGGLRRFSNRN